MNYPRTPSIAWGLRLVAVVLVAAQAALGYATYTDRAGTAAAPMRADVDAFGARWAGSGVPGNNPACAGMRLDADADVDQTDFGLFQVCYSGTKLAAPGCTGTGGGPGGGLPASGAFVLHGRPVDVLPDGHTLLFVRARFYDLQHGRWLQRDPTGFADGGNLYEAFGSNATSVRDPLGTEAELRYEGSLKWDDGGAGLARIRVYNDGGYWGRSRNLTVFELAVRSDVRGQGDPRTRAWVVLGEREYLVNVSALRSWLEGLDEAHRAPVIGDPSSELLAERLGESFAGTFGDRIHGILDVTTGQYLPGYNPNDPENIVQSTSEVRQGVRQAAAMGEAGMRQVMYGFLFAAGAEVVGKGAQVVSQGRGIAPPTGSAPPKGSGVWSKPPIARGIAIEENLAQTEYAGWYHVGATQRGKFPLVDFQKGDTLVSVRTANTTGTTWMSRTQAHIRALQDQQGLVSGRPAKMVLDLRVQPGGRPAAAPLVNYGKAHGIEVLITEHP